MVATSSKRSPIATGKATTDFLHTYYFIAISFGKLLIKPFISQMRKTF